jgi:general secretion pathway protein G
MEVKMHQFRKLVGLENKIGRWVFIALFVAMVCIGTQERLAGSQPKRYFAESLVNARKSKSIDAQSETLEKEKELRKSLRQIREAIKEYKQVCDEGLVGALDRKKDDQCYPPTLETLVNGIKRPNKNYYMVFLRRIPIDPITGKQDWGLHSIQDEKDSENWGGQNVSNVYSKAEGYASDWTRYREW